VEKTRACAVLFRQSLVFKPWAWIPKPAELGNEECIPMITVDAAIQGFMHGATDNKQ
jgi:hypothetical protein